MVNQRQNLDYSRICFYHALLTLLRVVYNERQIDTLFNSVVRPEFREPCAISFRDINEHFVKTSILDVLSKDPLEDVIFESSKYASQTDIDTMNNYFVDVMLEHIHDYSHLMIIVDGPAAVRHGSLFVEEPNVDTDTHVFIICEHPDHYVENNLIFIDQSSIRGELTKISKQKLKEGLRMVSNRSLAYPKGLYLNENPGKLSQEKNVRHR